MFMHVVCPGCGQKCRVPEAMLGQAAKCPACAMFFACGSVSPRSLATRPIPYAVVDAPLAEAMPQKPGAEDDGAERIRYRCSRCKSSLESPAHMAGQKLNCPDCGQRLQIPAAGAVPVSIVSHPGPSAAAPPATGPKPGKAKPKKEAPRPAPQARTENCLECGIDVSGRRRTQQCPDCGSIFCSAGCYREHRHHAHPSRG